MFVVSKKSTSKLIKGYTYEVRNLWNGSGNKLYYQDMVELKEINGLHPVDNFTDTNGNDLPKKNIWNDHFDYLKMEDVSEGEILVCVSDNYKTFYKGHMYKVEKLIIKEENRTTYNGKPYKHTERLIKFEGINRKMKFNGCAFRKLRPNESRDISLNGILYNKSPEITKTNSIRKIDLVENKNQSLMEAISLSIIDKNRHHLSVIDWLLQKKKNNLGLKPEDFNEILEMKLSDILKIIEK